MSVGSHTEEDEVEYGEAGGVFGGEGFYEDGFVVVCEFFDVVEEIGVDSVDVLGRERNFREEFPFAVGVVGVFVVEGDDSFIGEVDLPVYSSEHQDNRGCIRGKNSPLVPLDIGASDEAAQQLGHRSAADSKRKFPLLLNRLCLQTSNKSCDS